MTALVNIEAEAALLGAMMCHAKTIDTIADRVGSDDFAEPIHARIFATVVGQHSLGKIANPVTLRPLLASDLSAVGLDDSYLGQLTGSGAGVVGAGGFADQVRELAARRRFVEGLQRSIEAASDHEQSLDELAADADGAISALREQDSGANEYSAADALDMVIDSFDTPVTGALCGVVPSIDALLGPMRPSHLVIGAGRPGMGKTATAISYALGAAVLGHGVLFVSLEMAAEQLAERMAADLCLGSHIPYEAIRDRTLTLEQRREVCRARERIKDLPLHIIDRQGLTIGRLRTLVRRWKRRMAARGQKLELVIVDYLQLMRADNRSMSPYEAVSEISRSLKEIAKGEDLAVFALAQLSREVEKRPDKRPLLSDLRDSGQIEQDADAVIFFLRAEYYLAQSEPAPSDPNYPAWSAALDQCRGAIEFICAKRRNGSSGSRLGQFHAQFQAVR